MNSGWNFQFTELTKASAYPSLTQRIEVDKLLRVFLQQLPKQLKNIKILDIGCGDGNITKLIASSNPNSNVLGIDISEPFIKQAVSSEQFENLEFRKMNFYAMDEIPDKSVDIATSIYSFYVQQLSDIRSLCHQIAKKIKVGGEIKFLLNTIAAKKGCQLPSSVLDGDRMFPITLNDGKGKIFNFEKFGLLENEVIQGLLDVGFGDIRVQRLECSEKIGTGYVYRDLMAVIDVIIDARLGANELS